MKKIIIIEGADGCGKSTLISHVSEKFQYAIHKESLSYKDRLSKTYDGYSHYFSLLDIISRRGEKEVWDRLHIGEAVNPIIRKDGRKPLSLKEIHEVEQPIVDKAILITCIPSVSFTEKVFKERGEDVAVPVDIPYLFYLYEHFHNLSSIKEKYIFNVEEDKDYKKIDLYLEDLCR